MTTLSPQPVARDKKSGDVVHVELDIEGKAEMEDAMGVEIH